MMQSDNDDVPNITAEIQFNVNFVIKHLYKSTVKFIAILNNNFTEKNVTKFQSGIIQKLLTLMVSTLKIIMNNEIKESLFLSKFNQIITVISKSFQNYTSDLISKIKKN